MNFSTVFNYCDSLNCIISMSYVLCVSFLSSHHALPSLSPPGKFLTIFQDRTQISSTRNSFRILSTLWVWLVAPSPCSYLCSTWHAVRELFTCLFSCLENKVEFPLSRDYEDFCVCHCFNMPRVCPAQCVHAGKWSRHVCKLSEWEFEFKTVPSWRNNPDEENSTPWST